MQVQGAVRILPDVVHLAKPKNVHRDLMRRIMRGCTYPDEYWAYVPVFNKGNREVEEVPLPALLPHEALAHFIENDGTLLNSWATNPGHTIFYTVQVV